jgi:FkbM family methyltransferase
MFKSLLKLILKKIYANSIIGKPYRGTQSRIYFERSQHLMFAFKNMISYEPTIQSKIKKYIHKSGLVFDIGGNIGQYALFFSELVGSKGKVISVEPDFKNFSFLSFNTQINQLTNVVCIRKGVTECNTALEFYRDTETGGRRGSFNKNFVHENYRGYSEQVETVTLDSLIEEFGKPELIKIDVEGFEAQITKGLTKTLNQTVFLVEVRDETKNAVFVYFAEKGYSCYLIDQENDILISNSFQIPAFANLVFKKT